MTINPFNFKIPLLLPFILIAFTSCKDEKKEPPVVTEISKSNCLSDANPYFLFLADIHLNTYSKDTNEGDDTGMNLWNAAKQKIAAVLRQTPPPQFVIYTGDLPDHNPDSGKEHDANISKILTDLKQLVGKTPLFYAPGNNDALGGDYHTFTDYQGKTPFSLVPSTLNYPAPNAKMLSNPHPEYGYYSASPIPGLRIIAMNTIILGRNYFKDSSQGQYVPVDPKEKQRRSDTLMQWVGKELLAAQSNNEKAYLMMHIPPGIDAYCASPTTEAKACSSCPSPWKPKKMWESDSLLSIFRGYTKTYEKTISGIFYGHTHMDELRRIYDNEGQIQEIAISAPGISPNHGQNPGFKIVYYDNKTFESNDFTTYYTKRTDTVWGDDCYKFSDSYGCTGSTIKDCLSSKSLDGVLKGMQKTYMVKNGNACYNIEKGIEVK